MTNYNGVGFAICIFASAFLAQQAYNLMGGFIDRRKGVTGTSLTLLASLGSWFAIYFALVAAINRFGSHSPGDIFEARSYSKPFDMHIVFDGSRSIQVLRSTLVREDGDYRIQDVQIRDQKIPAWVEEAISFDDWSQGHIGETKMKIKFPKVDIRP